MIPLEHGSISNSALSVASVETLTCIGTLLLAKSDRILTIENFSFKIIKSIVFTCHIKYIYTIMIGVCPKNVANKFGKHLIEHPHKSPPKSSI